MNNKNLCPKFAVAILFNIVVLIILLFWPSINSKKKTIEVKVNIEHYSLPKSKPTIPEKRNITEKNKISNSHSDNKIFKELSSTKEVVKKTMHNITPVEIKNMIKPEQSISEKHSTLNRIQNDIDFFNGLNKILANEQKGNKGIPAGHKAGKSFQARLGNERRKLLKRYGGDCTSESAVEKALKYLSSIQNKDGSWGSHDSYETGDVVALTSFALLTFLSHGESYSSQKYSKTVSKALDFLIDASHKDNIEYAGQGFGHAILVYALAEAYALSGSMTLEQVVKTRVKEIIQRQNKFGSYNTNYDNSPYITTNSESNEHQDSPEAIAGEPVCDLSLLGWHVQALTAAKTSGINVNGLNKALTLATEAIINIHQAQNGGFSSGINMKNLMADENMVPVGLLGLNLLGAGNCIPAKKAEKLLKKTCLPKWKTSGCFPLYRWYYQTQALFLATNGRGSLWKNWNDNLKKELTRHQQDNGRWNMPNGDKSFRLKNRDDLSIYSTSLCCLMLQVYYRYLPSYNISESSCSKVNYADNIDLGMKGLITRLPGGADPMADIILGLGPVKMKALYFGLFNGFPNSINDPFYESEFKLLASFASTIPVKSDKDWPQTLQPNQRIAMFLDDLLPENFKGHLLLTMSLIADNANVSEHKSSIEVTINNKRVYNSILLRHKEMVRVLIPSELLMDFGSIIQVRNNGKHVIAFDGCKLSSITRLGRKLLLAADKIAVLPQNIQQCFNSGVIDVNKHKLLKLINKEYLYLKSTQKKPIFRIMKIKTAKLKALLKSYADKNIYWELAVSEMNLMQEYSNLIKSYNSKSKVILKTDKTAGMLGNSFQLSAFTGYRQALPKLTALKKYNTKKHYWGTWECIGNERMGREFQLHYLRGIGRGICEWLASGGNTVILQSVYSGGMFYDKTFKTELPPLFALRQVSKLFDGAPRQLPATVYPKSGEDPLYATNAVAAYNAPGVVTIVVTKRFPLPIETEVQAIVPWEGGTEMRVEKGFFPQSSLYSSFGEKLQVTTEAINISNKHFKYSGILPEMTIIRLIRKDSEVPEKKMLANIYIPPDKKIDLSSVKTSIPDRLLNRKKYEFHPLRTANCFSSISGNNPSFQVIPATLGKKFKPYEKESLDLSFNITEKQNHNSSIYLSLGKGCKNAEYLSFYVNTRLTGKKAPPNVLRVPLTLNFSNKCFKVNVPVNRWQQVFIKLDKDIKTPEWSYIRILQPDKRPLKKATSINYEINNVCLVKQKHI